MTKILGRNLALSIQQIKRCDPQESWPGIGHTGILGPLLARDPNYPVPGNSRSEALIQQEELECHPRRTEVSVW
jgi:hypothetical protein